MTNPGLEAKKPAQGINPRFNNQLAAGCSILFLLPFAGVGTFTALRAIRLAHLGNWREAMLYAVFALVFGGVGYGGLLGIRVALGKMKEESDLKTLHPTEPWLWRPSWASRRIEDSSRGDLLGAWIFAGLWNLVSLPSAYLGVQAALAQNKPAIFVVLLFPLVGAWLLARAIRITLRERKYGVSRLELSTLPGVIGHTLAGTVRANLDRLPPEGFRVELTCVRLVTSRSGKSSSTSETILWQEEQSVRGEQIRDFSGMGVRIPISFSLPADAEPWDTTDSRNRVLWRLHLSAGVPGVDYDSTFEVPVFRTAASLTAGDQESPVAAASAAPYRQPAGSRIQVTTNQRGTEILFPAGRNPGAAIGLTTFMIIWWAAVGIQLYFGVPVIFPIVTSLFGLLITVGVLERWLKVSRVVVGAGSITVATGYLHPGRERRIAAGEVSDVVTAIGMQAGKVPYYDVEILRKDGKKVVAGRSVRDKREAEWLAATIKRALAG
jgi:hypothetical protein